MQHVEEQQQAEKHPMTFRDMVDFAIICGCIPALILSVVFWAIATAFPKVGALPVIMSLLITLQLAVMGIVLIVRYVDICVINIRAYNAAPPSQSDEPLMTAIGAGIVCGFLALGIVGCLAVSGILEGYHNTIMVGEVVLVGYQTWRVFLGQQQ